MTLEHTWYQTRYRRMLVDMHIPDWDPAFLAHYDPQRMIDLYVQANLNAVMFYCQSHVGLCYWPTTTGKQHAGLNGRDIVGELLALLNEHDIAATAYYSLIFNNQAALDHPDWAIISPKGYHKPGRYGHVCPNNPDYRAFALAQTEELVTGYDFDGFFFDMTFWPDICVCPHCRKRYLEETGRPIPLTIDWLSPEWCAFQAARERWIEEFAGMFTAQARLRNPDMPVYHNFATALIGWSPAVPFSSAQHHTFLGADFYGDRVEQLLACKTMLNLSEHRPIEFMTSACVTVANHVTLKPAAEMTLQAYAALLFSAAFLFIDAVNPDGTIEPEPFAEVGEIFEETSRYEPYLGGTSVEDIGVYFSDASRADFSKNGAPIGQATWGHGTHTQAVRGMCRLLQQAHLPFGVITRKQLPVLDRYKVVVLPDVSRMDAGEVEAIRAYVRGGGRVYASGMTSLTETQGVRRADFALADVFGCHFAAVDAGKTTYLKPATSRVIRPRLASEVRPARRDHAPPSTAGRGRDPGHPQSALRQPRARLPLRPRVVEHPHLAAMGGHRASGPRAPPGRERAGRLLRGGPGGGRERRQHPAAHRPDARPARRSLLYRRDTPRRVDERHAPARPRALPDRVPQCAASGAARARPADPLHPQATGGDKGHGAAPIA